jgi:hypothetical protein
VFPSALRFAIDGTSRHCSCRVIVKYKGKDLTLTYSPVNQASGSASLTPMYGDFLETLPDPVAHPLEW